MLTDKSNATLREARYKAFEERSILTNAIPNNFGFLGQVWDEETGLWQNWRRGYDHRIRRYVEGDPIGLKGGVNTYGYALGNPITQFDSDGLSPSKYCSVCVTTECLLYGGNLCDPGKGSFCCSSPEYAVCIASFLTAHYTVYSLFEKRGKNTHACARIKTNCRKKYCSIKPNCGCPDGTTEEIF